ncbi:hypothetical protein [Thioflexithrix psekupsensis]|uniref:CRISPR system ring nuclease SSO1393-like domain-containing protein n=1 Tax=Thioflexithrix psekupsensis TaxID=1570016 RepID=A0A251X8Z5_9GAMM|nr:hypothetical protein [Thioflexithrix psekupsensis]OUD14538.1 hypothetical protein TPSD3_09605 [Thioflexithrix psekupsensis]
MKTLITTVGTSLFTNYMKPEIKGEIRSDYESIDSQFDSISNASASKYDYYNGKVNHIREYIKSLWFKRNGEPNVAASAEIKSILKIGEELGDIRVHLLATDSVSSVIAAELIKEWFEAYHSNIEVEFNKKLDTINELNVQSKMVFESKGLINLVERYYCIIDSSYKDYCALNITGGYKALIPFLSMFAQLNRIPIFYLFEDTDDVIKIPQAPINLDWIFIGNNSSIFNILNETVLVSHSVSWESYKKEKQIPSEFDFYYLEEADNENRIFSLNAMGRVVWREYDNSFLVKVPYDFKFFKDQPSNQDKVREAIRVLKSKLGNLSQDFNTFVDENIKHCKIGDSTWVCKDSNLRIRLQYKYEQESQQLTVYNYYFIDSEVADKSYSTRIENEFNNKLKNAPLTILALQKPLRNNQ